jgi:hypothetical protein
VVSEADGKRLKEVALLFFLGNKDNYKLLGKT